MEENAVLNNIIKTINGYMEENVPNEAEFIDFPFIKQRLNQNIFIDISSDRQRQNGTLKLKFPFIRRMGEHKGERVDIIFTFYPLSGNVIRDDKTYIFEGTPGFTDKNICIKEFIRYFYFKFEITAEESTIYKNYLKSLDEK